MSEVNVLTLDVTCVNGSTVEVDERSVSSVREDNVLNLSPVVDSYTAADDGALVDVKRLLISVE